jgi:CCR4-NOT transcription complex subunit 2
VTRDENYPAPVEVEREISEQGFYIWWDWKGWKKVRVSVSTLFSSLCMA